MHPHCEPSSCPMCRGVHSRVHERGIKCDGPAVPSCGELSRHAGYLSGAVVLLPAFEETFIWLGLAGRVRATCVADVSMCV